MAAPGADGWSEPTTLPLVDSPDNLEKPSNQISREENVKHLEWILGIVVRMNGNSFLIKSWCLTVTAATYGFAVNRVDWRLTVIGMLAVLGFWLLDTYFLRQERLFRLLYDHVRIDARAVPRFSMATTRYRDREAVRYWNVFGSITLRLFYGILLVLGLTVFILAIIFRPELVQMPDCSRPQ